MERRTLLRAVLLAVVLATGGYLVLRMTREQTAPRTPPVASSRPDYFLGDARLEQTTANGRVLYTLDARRMQHYPDDGRTRLTRVRLVYHAAGHPPWTLTAEHAMIPASRKRVELRGNVHGSYRARNGSTPIILSTPEMTVLVDRQIASTSAGARLASGPSHVTARRLRVDLKTGVIRLQQDVEATYVP